MVVILGDMQPLFSVSTIGHTHHDKSILAAITLVSTELGYFKTVVLERRKNLNS
jgi:translation elongation factor EF-Tu-like GTPase